MSTIHKVNFPFLSEPNTEIRASKLEGIQAAEDFPWSETETPIARLCLSGACQKFPLQKLFGWLQQKIGDLMRPEMTEYEGSWMLYR